jgi:hypothetical protein
MYTNTEISIWNKIQEDKLGLEFNEDNGNNIFLKVSTNDRNIENKKIDKNNEVQMKALEVIMAMVDEMVISKGLALSSGNYNDFKVKSEELMDKIKNL